MFTGRGLLSSVGATSRSRPGGRSYQISAASVRATSRSRPGGRSYQISCDNETLSHENGISLDIQFTCLYFRTHVTIV